MKQDTTPLLERIAHKAVSQTWTGRSGPRNFRVLAGLLKRQEWLGSSSLWCRVGLRELAVRSGLSDNTKQVSKALAALAADGWLTYKAATCEVTLICSASTEQYPLSSLPDPVMSCYRNSDGSTSGSKLYIQRAVEHFRHPTEETERWLDKEAGYFSRDDERIIKFEASRDGYRTMTGPKHHVAVRGIADWIAEGASDVLKSPVVVASSSPLPLPDVSTYNPPAILDL
jgi:hypothetical protein